MNATNICKGSTALRQKSRFMPLRAENYLQLTDNEVAHIDQFLFRFSKLQDAMGEKLFLLILELLKEENVKNKPFIDILNRLEQIGLLEDKTIWLELRKIRHSIAHQYEDAPQQMVEALNAIYMKKSTLQEIYLHFKANYIARR